jgi:NADH-quinone oxidoreductase subunit E
VSDETDDRPVPGEQTPAERDAEDRGVPDTERVPEGLPFPDQVGTAGTAGTPAAEGAAGWDRAADLSKDPAVIPDPAETYVPDGLRAAIEDAMAKYPDRRSAVIPALHAAQALHGWCSPEGIHQVAAVMQVTPAYLSSIASFYDMLNEEPVGSRHVYVCTGVACIPAHPEPVLEALEQEAERQGLEDTEIRNFECLGACDMAPMASVDGRYVGPLDPSDAPEVIAAIKDGRTVLPGRGLEDSDYRLPWGGRA